jgi:hypothetical protein
MADEDKDEELFTGAFTFPQPGDSERRQFGMVGCVSSAGAPGRVTLFLRHRDSGIACEVDETPVKIVIRSS